MEDDKEDLNRLGHYLSKEHEDPLIALLHKVIHLAVRILAILMVAVIVWGIGDVLYVLYGRLIQRPFLLLRINDILATFGSFLAVLIAVEIFINITMYLKTDVIPVRLVVATALMAISRKVIIFDFEEITPLFVIATSATVCALGITYWLISKKT